MRVKKKLIVFLVLFALVLWLIFSSMEKRVITNNCLTNPTLPDCVLEARIVQLEMRITENKLTLEVLNDVISRLESLKDNSTENVQEILQRVHELKSKFISDTANEDKMNVENFETRVRLPAEICSADATSQQAKSDIDMLNLYDKLNFENPDGGVWKQGFPIVINPDDWKKEKLLVFVVPHSHQDPGWVETYDTYYTSSSSNSLTEMLHFLRDHPQMRFIYAEIAFFHRWFESLDAADKATVKKLLDNKQFEIVSGGWVMTDEANAHFYNTIEEMTEGHRWLLNNLNYQPKVSWSIDPFGHSSSMPYLWRKIGFQHMLIQRTHYAVKKELASEKNLEYIWRQRWDKEGKNDIFCHMMPFYSYDIPHTCGPDPAICCQFDFGRLTCPWRQSPVPIDNQNVAQRAAILLDQYRKKASLYRYNVVLIPLGDDFRYVTTNEWKAQYTNYQQLFDYMNAQADFNIEVKFGILSDYFDAVSKRAGTASSQSSSSSVGSAPILLPKGYPTLMGDMFTYADKDDNYWSGYFTSRPYHKRMDRFVMDKLRQAEILFSMTLATAQRLSITWSWNDVYAKLTVARRQLSLFQHHDGVTGTAKTFVMHDYEARLKKALENSLSVVQSCLRILCDSNQVKQRNANANNLFIVDVGEYNVDFQRDDADKILLDNSKPADTQKVYVFNSLPHSRKGVVTVRINTPHITLHGSGNEEVPFEVSLFLIPSMTLPDGGNDYIVRFPVELLPLTMQLFTISKLPNSTPVSSGHLVNISTLGSSTSHSKNAAAVFSVLPEPPHPTLQLENKNFLFTFASDTGMLQSITNKATRITSKLAFSFHKYKSKQGHDMSGAYLFIPDGASQPFSNSNAEIQIVRGKWMHEVIVTLRTVKHHVRIHNDDNNPAFEVINYVDLTVDSSDIELVMQVETDFKKTNKQFYTDQNCYQLTLRKTLDKLPLQANVYPMSCGFYMEDDSTRLTILAAQPQGVTMPTSSTVQLWLDRRLNQDDNRGLGQGVTDNRLWTPDRFTFLLETMQQSPDRAQSPPSKQGYLTATGQFYLNSLLHPLQPWYLHPSSPGSWAMNINLMTGTGLPCDMSLVNLRTALTPSSNYETVMTLHRHAPHCGAPWFNNVNCAFSVNGSVTYKNLFNDLTIHKVERISLSQVSTLATIVDKFIYVSPMEIEAFKVHFEGNP